MNIIVTDYGARPDGSVCTAAIQRAIDECHQNGGGRVSVPAGVFTIGTVFLKDHVELHLACGATLKGSTDLADYNAEDAYVQNWGCPSEEWLGKHMIVAVECCDVAITGLGTIDGSGDFFFGEPVYRPQNYGWRRGFSLAGDKKMLRPGQAVCFIESNDVHVENITIRNTCAWACFLHGCERVTVRGIKVFNPPHFGNTDGIDVDSCRYVTISDCIIHTGDDAITFRCNGWRLSHHESICEHVAVTNCTLSCSACAFRIGVGTGIIRHIRVSNITISSAGYAIHYMTSYCNHGSAEIYDVNFSHISGTDIGYALRLVGHVGAIRDVTLEDIRLSALAGAALCAEGECCMKNVSLRNVELHLVHDGTQEIPLRRAKWGDTVFLAEHVNGLLLDRISILMDGDTRETWGQLFACRNCQETKILHCDFEA